MKSNIQARLAKLEAATPKEPSLIDSMTRDELIAFILAECSALLASYDLPEESRAYVEQALFDTREMAIPQKAGGRAVNSGKFAEGVFT